MRIKARLQNSPGQHQVQLETDGQPHPLAVAPKASGAGSSVNGGELLFLALATCYCNDLYREAARKGIEVHSVEVEVAGEFGGPGEPGRNISYRVRVEANASKEEIASLAVQTDQLAEIQNTLRGGVPVQLAQIDAVLPPGPQQNHLSATRPGSLPENPSNTELPDGST